MLTSGCPQLDAHAYGRGRIAAPPDGRTSTQPHGRDPHGHTTSRLPCCMAAWLPGRRCPTAWPCAGKLRDRARLDSHATA
eukprot:15452932-Alexandrium_andersonii.AAC.1